MIELATCGMSTIQDFYLWDLKYYVYPAVS